MGALLATVALAENRQAGAVDHEMQWSPHGHAVGSEIQALTAPRERRMDRRLEIGTQEREDGPQEALGVP